jgi:hypothetical protein
MNFHFTLIQLAKLTNLLILSIGKDATGILMSGYVNWKTTVGVKVQAKNQMAPSK